MAKKIVMRCLLWAVMLGVVYVAVSITNTRQRREWRALALPIVIVSHLRKEFSERKGLDVEVVKGVLDEMGENRDWIVTQDGPIGSYYDVVVAVAVGEAETVTEAAVMGLSRDWGKVVTCEGAESVEGEVIRKRIDDGELTVVGYVGREDAWYWWLEGY